MHVADSMRFDCYASPAKIDRDRREADLFFAREATQKSRYLTRTYQQRRNLVLSLVGDELSYRQKIPTQCTALDFGCGAGVMVKELSRMGINVTAVDRSRAMIEAAQSRLGSSCTAALELLRDDLGEDGAYRRRSYDLILCLSVLEFVSSPEELIAHLAGLLAVGGLLILTVPNRNSYFRRLERFGFHHPEFSRWLPGLNHLASPDCYLRHQRRQFTAEELSDSSKQLGLDVEDHRFHVAPNLCGPTERFEKVGMMILLSFRKSLNATRDDVASSCPSQNQVRPSSTPAN